MGARHAGDTFEEIAMRDGPLAAVFAPEGPKFLASVIGDSLLPSDVVVLCKGMSRVEALRQAGGVSGIDEIRVGAGKLLDGLQVLRPAREFHRLARAGNVGPATVPPTTLDQLPVGGLQDEVLAPRWRVAVDVLVIVVRAKEVAELHHAAGAVGEPGIAAQFGGGRHDIGMLVVISAPRPAAQPDPKSVV